MEQAMIGQKVLIEGADCTHIVRGFDPVSNRFWLCAEEGTYEGDNGDLIVGLDDGKLIVHLRPDRASVKTGDRYVTL